MNARIAAVAGLALAGCAGLLGQAGAARQGRSSAPLVSTPDGDIRLVRYPGGEPWALSGERGTVVLLDLWASWCEPCKEALPAYQALHAARADAGLVVYAVSVDADVSQVGPFLAGNGVTLPVLLDPGGAVAESQLKVSMMPTTFVFDRDGRQVHVHQGWEGAPSPELVEAVERALDGGAR